MTPLSYLAKVEKNIRMDIALDYYFLFQLFFVRFPYRYMNFYS